MSANNSINLVGRLTRDPELKKTSSGKSITTFTLAVDRHSKGAKKTDFINCDAWERTAEIVTQYAHKGPRFRRSAHRCTSDDKSFISVRNV